MKKVILIGAVLLSTATVSAKALSTDAAAELDCLNAMHNAAPRLLQPKYTWHSGLAHYMFFSSPQIGGNPGAKGFFRLTPDKIEYCEMNWPNRKNFKFTDPSTQEIVVYQTSDGTDKTPEEQMQNVSAIGCKNSRDIQGAGEWYMRSQMQEMAKRIGAQKSKSEAKGAWEVIDGQNKTCSRFDKVRGSFFDANLEANTNDPATTENNSGPKR